jgi:hypothetical protein
MLCTALACAAHALAAEVEDLAFDAPVPGADRAELAARLLHGYQASRVAALAAARGTPLGGAPVDPRRERWRVYAPDACRDAPCGVLVWIDPLPAPGLPRDWLRVLDAQRMIYVGAHDSGNERDVVDRRVPLALFGLAGIEARHQLDARRYIAGWSGGARTASRAASAYPELFAGAYLVATADGPGTVDSPLPGGERLAALRAQRVYMVVGDIDPENFEILRGAQRAYQRTCVLDNEFEVVRGWTHRRPDGRALQRALRWLDEGPRATDEARASCAAEALRSASAAVDGAERLAAAGERSAARRALLEAHVAWGGLIAERFAALIGALEGSAD